ncbi:MAG: hypothetical protein ABEJ44_04810 [Halanaeroarchaeum sp.]
MSFSDLFRAVDYENAGNFSYHLKKLVGAFVTKTDAGYLLNPSGRKIVRAMIASIGDVSAINDADIDMDCPFCGGAKQLVYRDEMLYLVCNECAGGLGENPEHPPGTLSALELDPAGIAGRSAEEIIHAAYARARHAFGAAIEGICDECSGSMQRSLSICSDHDPAGQCAECGRFMEIMAEFSCPVCKNYHAAPPRTVVAQHPAVVSFYWEKGIALQYEVTDFASHQQGGAVIERHEQEIVSVDPPRVRVSIDVEGDRLSLVLDEQLSAIDITNG